MYFDDYWSLSPPFFGVMAGIILDQFFNFNKTQGLKLILAWNQLLIQKKATRNP